LNKYSYVLTEENPLGGETILGVFHRKYEATYFVSVHYLDKTKLTLWAYRLKCYYIVEKRKIEQGNW
jgi:hypothetical protein